MNSSFCGSPYKNELWKIIYDVNQQYNGSLRSKYFAEKFKLYNNFITDHMILKSMIINIVEILSADNPRWLQEYKEYYFVNV